MEIFKTPVKKLSENAQEIFNHIEKKKASEQVKSTQSLQFDSTTSQFFMPSLNDSALLQRRRSSKRSKPENNQPESLNITS